MAMTTEELRVKLIDAKKAESELRNVRKELERTTGATSEHGKASKTAAEHHGLASKALGGIKGALMYGGGLLGITAVGYGLSDVVKGGIRAQEQQRLLQQALRQTGQQGSGHINQLNQAIAQTTASGGFGRLEETEGLASFVRETKNATTAARDNREAIALARGAHESYGTAVMQVSRIETGQVGRLQRYLGIIQPVKYWVDQLTAAQKKDDPAKVKRYELLDKEATATEAAQRIQERYGGAVVAYNKSAAGAINNANNAFKNATDTLGEKLLPAVTAVAKSFSEVITEITKGEGIWKTLEQDGKKTWEVLSEVWKFFEKNKIAAQGLFVALGALGTIWATEKVLGYVRALRELMVVQTVAKGVNTLADANFAGVAAGFAKWLPAIAAVAGLVYGIKELNKILPAGDRPENLLGGNQPGEKKREDTPLVQIQAARYFATHPRALGIELEREGRQHEQIAPAEAQALQKFDLHMDSTKVAEVMFKNPRVRRMWAEGTLKHTLGIQGLQ